ncbi:RNA polymerase subunit sigma-70 [uncultured Dysosmobacter sp.]|uniref:RNA polymerase subunit sigma-70 n=1 Tax=uncultured Dysosmobacter sp. TaxID=2591384 RepID=UPI002616D8BC|nr:RNA polymerase subunit sigma-70 [uncultured Dysosmobacter sp.]
MTDTQKDRIRQMKADGVGYIKIARELGLSENTVKSFCRREGLNGKALDGMSPAPGTDIGICPCCGTKVVQNPGRKMKKFCSDKCRNKWWNSHQDRVKRRAHYEFVCAYCKKPFTAYGNAGRKYCSHACYVADRFGGGADE